MEKPASEKSVSVKTEKPLIDLPSQREKVMFKTSQSKKDCVKRKWLEKMNQLKKHILFFDFLENHYVSKDEVSKQH